LANVEARMDVAGSKQCDLESWIDSEADVKQLENVEARNGCS